MVLQENHPEIAFRDCLHCQLWIYDESTGLPLSHAGKLQPRNVASPPPCRPYQDGRPARGCLKGTPEQSNALTMANLRALSFYRMKLAVGRVPHDPLSEEIAGIIQMTDERLKVSRAARMSGEQTAAILSPLLQLLIVKR